MMARLGEASHGLAWRVLARRAMAGAMAVLLVAAIASPGEAATCHHFRTWRYPWPQRCSVIRQIPPNSARREKSAIELPTVEIPLPFLARADLAGGEADQVTAARLQLLGYAYAH